MSAIFVDNLCDLNGAELKKLGLNLVALNKADAYESAFTPFLQEEEDILYFATNLSCVKQNLQIVLDNLLKKYNHRQIKVVDLKSTSVCAGLIVYEIGLAYKRGCTDQEILSFSKDFNQQVYGLFVTQSGEFLKSCKGLEKINSNSKLNLIFPIVYVKGEKNEIVDKAQGKKRAFAIISNVLNEHATNMADYPIVIGYGDDEINAKFLKDLLIKMFGKDLTVLLVKLSDFNTTKFGDNAILMAFYSKQIK